MDPAPEKATSARRVLVVDDDPAIRDQVRAALVAAGHTVETAETGQEALDKLAADVPDLVVSDITMPLMDGFELVSQIRSQPSTQALPLIFLTSRAEPEDAVRGLQLGADDYVRKPFEVDELVARVEAKLERPPVPAAQLTRRTTPLVSETRLYEELDREIGRASRTRRPGVIAALDLAERRSVAERLGSRADQDLRVQMSVLAAGGAEELDLVALDSAGRLLVLMPETDPEQARERLLRLSEHLARGSFMAANEPINATPVVGFAVFDGKPPDAGTYVHRAVVAADGAAEHLDLQPVEWTPGLEAAPAPPPPATRTAATRRRLRTPVQVAITLLAGIVLPFVAYVVSDLFGFNLARPVYIAVVCALLLTATLIWIEGFLALDPPRPPDEPAAPYPAASAIIAAYLPNEAATIVETVETFLRADYPGPLQIILAYNTPQPMPVEDVFTEITARDARFVPYRVEVSTSKAQNVNAALGLVSGEFVGIFDADHHPDPDSFRRAWRWLSSGYDVVQGHCVVRNGDASWVARTVAVEFESIYAVSHPGRARLHDFGIFGGSNGYWRTELLRRVRMHGFMLTEDIDSSLRVVEAGGKIAVDPALISRELAPTSLSALWKQRMRWAQGWFQVSLKHLRTGWRSPALTPRQKFGFTFLLGWREIYPWLSVQVFPLIAFFALKAGSVARISWLIPIFILTTLFTLSVGPGQTYFAWRLGEPQIRRRRGWFLSYLVVSSLFYTEMKNVIARVAQLKEAVGEHQWVVTARAAGEDSAEANVSTSDRGAG
jgi:cellulose synthase/poly-beta-1,6-N-acetylglucosamine synthase-like glycosyltransferase/CheY-like chemotaxis protein/GGDEF domain-containing protein